MLPDELIGARPVTLPKFTELVVTLHQTITFTLTGKTPVVAPAAATTPGKRRQIMIRPEAMIVALILEPLLTPAFSSPAALW